MFSVIYLSEDVKTQTVETSSGSNPPSSYRQMKNTWLPTRNAASNLIQMFYNYYFILLNTGRQTNKMCVARSVWRSDTGPTNARGRGNMCTDRRGQLRWRRNSRRMKRNSSASPGKTPPPQSRRLTSSVQIITGVYWIGSIVIAQSATTCILCI